MSICSIDHPPDGVSAEASRHSPDLADRDVREQLVKPRPCAATSGRDLAGEAAALVDRHLKDVRHEVGRLDPFGVARVDDDAPHESRRHLRKLSIHVRKRTGRSLRSDPDVSEERCHANNPVREAVDLSDDRAARCDLPQAAEGIVKLRRLDPEALALARDHFVDPLDDDGRSRLPVNFYKSHFSVPLSDAFPDDLSR